MNILRKALLLPGTLPILADNILRKILTKTSILMQICIEDHCVSINWQNLLLFRQNFERKHKYKLQIILKVATFEDFQMTFIISFKF